MNNKINYMNEMKTLFKAANEKDGIQAAERASDAIDRLNDLYTKVCAANLGIGKKVSEKELINAVQELDACGEKYVGKKYCGSTDIKVVKKFMNDFLQSLYSHR